MLGQEFSSAQDIVDVVSTRGAFLWKDHPLSLLNSWGAPHRHPFLADKGTKHIFLTRNPVDTVRGVAVGIVRTGYFPTLNPALTRNFVSMGYDTEDIQAMMDSSGGHTEQKLLYRYLTEVVEAPHILFVEIEDLWNDPKAALRGIAAFLGIEFTQALLKWNGPSFDVTSWPEYLLPWFDVINRSKGWIPRCKKGAAGGAAASTAGTTASIGEGILPEAWATAMARTTEKQLVAYRWLREHVPARQRLGIVHADGSCGGRNSSSGFTRI